MHVVLGEQQQKLLPRAVCSFLQLGVTPSLLSAPLRHQGGLSVWRLLQQLRGSARLSCVHRRPEVSQLCSGTGGFIPASPWIPGTDGTCQIHKRSWAIPCYQTDLSLLNRGWGLSVNKQQLVRAEFSAGYNCPWGFSLKGPFGFSPGSPLHLWSWPYRGFHALAVVLSLPNCSPASHRAACVLGGRLKTWFPCIRATAFLSKHFPFQNKANPRCFHSAVGAVLRGAGKADKCWPRAGCRSCAASTGQW